MVLTHSGSTVGPMPTAKYPSIAPSIPLSRTQRRLLSYSDLCPVCARSRTPPAPWRQVLDVSPKRRGDVLEHGDSRIALTVFDAAQTGLVDLREIGRPLP